MIDVLLEEGQPVRAGQVLAHLDDTQARASLNLAEAQLAAARKSMAEDQAKLAQAEVSSWLSGIASEKRFAGGSPAFVVDVLVSRMPPAAVGSSGHAHSL